MSSADVRHLPCCTMLLDQMESVCRPPQTIRLSTTHSIIRHFNDQRQLVHFGYMGCKDTCKVEESMEVYEVDIIQIRVPHGRKFMKERFHPILAGYAPDNRPAYYADLTHCTQNIYFHDYSYCTVEEGMTPADALIHNHVEDAIAPEEAYFEVYVLRYAPETYPRRYGPDDFMSGKDDGIDATGPYSWRPVGRLAYEDVDGCRYKLLIDPSSGRIINRKFNCFLD